MANFISTMVTTPRLGLELREISGLREDGRNMGPEKPEKRLPAANGATKLVERDEEDVAMAWVRVGFRVGEGVAHVVNIRA